MSSVSKVVFGNTTVMDITDSTVDSDTLLTGTKAYGANGDPVIGGVVKSWTGTAAQYAQEASQIPDGTQVNILDDFTPVGMPIGIADIYSTEEREIGVWTDGKPLYQKTISFGVLPNNTTKSVEHGVSNISTKFIANAFSKNSNNLTIPIPYATAPTTDQAQIYIDNTYINIKTPTNMAGYTDTYITINYTKTTDTPGSGKYVPSGAPAVHYSTDEQIIGTWIDGSTLYEKTYEITTPSVTATPTAVIEYPSNFAIKHIDGLFNNANPINIYRGANYYTATFNNKTNHTIDVEAKGISVGVSGIITLQYTKSTT